VYKSQEGQTNFFARGVFSHSSNAIDEVPSYMEAKALMHKNRLLCSYKIQANPRYTAAYEAITQVKHRTEQRNERIKKALDDWDLKKSQSRNSNPFEQDVWMNRLPGTTSFGQKSAVSYAYVPDVEPLREEIVEEKPTVISEEKDSDVDNEEVQGKVEGKEDVAEQTKNETSSIKSEPQPKPAGVLQIPSNRRDSE
jgi:hypothetical protein